MADFPRDAFADVTANNKTFAATFADQGLSGFAAQGLAIITCMDSRIAPLSIVGMKPGDVKILRNAGARVTPDTLSRALTLGHKAADSLLRNDAHGYFDALGDLVVTGPTYTNVNDFRAIIVNLA